MTPIALPHLADAGGHDLVAGWAVALASGVSVVAPDAATLPPGAGVALDALRRAGWWRAADGAWLPGTGAPMLDTGAAPAAWALWLLLPALLARAACRVEIHGATHPAEGLAVDGLLRTLAPLAERLGPVVETNLLRLGSGAPPGRVAIAVSTAPLGRLDLTERGFLARVRAEVVAGGPPGHERRAQDARDALVAALGLPPSDGRVRGVSSASPVLRLVVVADAEHASVTFEAAVPQGAPPWAAASALAQRVAAWQAADAPVDAATAWLLLPLLAVAGGQVRAIAGGAPLRAAAATCSAVGAPVSVAQDSPRTVLLEAPGARRAPAGRLAR